MARNYINTIQDMMNIVYGSPSSQQLMEIFKADSPVLSSTAGVYNPVFGAQVWAQINQEANVFSALPKIPHKKSGWRALSVRAGSSADGGVGENAPLPDTIKPTFVEIFAKPKHTVHNFDVSIIQQFLAAESEDDAYGSLEQLRVEMAKKHREAINQQLLVDNQTSAGNSFESLDRVVASNGELVEKTLAANSLDVYGLDRDAGPSFTDAYVDSNPTNRDLTDALIRTGITSIGEAGGNTTVIITGWDTYRKVLGLYDPQVRYEILGTTPTTIGVNGINTPDGYPVGLKISTLYGIPIIISKDVKKDAISRMYFLDTSDIDGYGEPRLHFRTAFPTLYFESPDFFGVNKLGKEGMFITGGELICKFFKAQGKIRDLQ